MNIKDCFKEDFTGWLLKSNNPNVSEKESLEEILDILLREPEADYFWYTYPVVAQIELIYHHRGTSSDTDSRLIYSTPKDEAVPSDSLGVDRDKVKAFLRDYKIESILNK
jgi:hypothetical protein